MVKAAADNLTVVHHYSADRHLPRCSGLDRELECGAHEALVVIYSHSIVAGGLPEMS